MTDLGAGRGKKSPAATTSFGVELRGRGGSTATSPDPYSPAAPGDNDCPYTDLCPVDAVLGMPRAGRPAPHFRQNLPVAEMDSSVRLTPVGHRLQAIGHKRTGNELPRSMASRASICTGNESAGGRPGGSESGGA